MKRNDQLDQYKSGRERNDEAATAAMSEDDRKAAAAARAVDEETRLEMERLENEDADGAGGQGKDAAAAGKGDDDGDADEAADGAQSPTVPNRLAKLELVADKIEQNRKASQDADDDGEGDDGEGDEDDDAAAAAAGDSAAGDAAAQEAAARTAAEDAGYSIRKNEQGVDCLVLVSDGKEVLRPLKEITVREQKDFNADQKLERASVAMKTLRTMTDSVRRQAEALTAARTDLENTVKQISESPLPSKGEDADKRKALVSGLVEAIEDGDTDKALNNLDTLLAGRGDLTQDSKERLQASVSKVLDGQQDLAAQQEELNRIQADLDSEQEQQLQTEWDGAITTFKTEYPEIKKGGEAWKLADRLCGQIQKEPEFRNASLLDIMREAGKRVRAVASEFAPNLDSRRQRKIDSASHVASRSGQSQARRREAPERPPTHAEQIAEMRKSRRPHAPY